MNSGCDNCCSQQLGFPIRTSPDHSLLAAPRSLSQLTTSFIAYLRQGIHTHALSSLTIKSILNTDVLLSALLAFTCSKCPSIFNFQRSNNNCKFVVGLGRIELPTSPLSGVRSSQLSYRPDLVASCQLPVPSCQFHFLTTSH